MFSFKKNKHQEGQMILLCEERKLEVIMSALCGSFGVSRQDDSNTMTLSDEGIVVRIKAVTREMGEEAVKTVDQVKNGMVGNDSIKIGVAENNEQNREKRLLSR